jgi:PTS system sucrose-specific IIC component
VSEIADTLHALTIRSSNDTEILLLVGIDTFTLNGNGLTPLVSEGDRVHPGQPLMEVDLEQVEKAGLCPIVITVLTA